MRTSVVIRPVRLTDLDDIYKLSKSAQPGLTNLLPDKTLIEKKIKRSIQSFSKAVEKPNNELYFFVMEDIREKKIIGTSGIIADIGDPAYHFKVSREVLSSQELNVKKENIFLQLVNDYHNVSEVGLLLLNKKYRKHGLGKFLSRARYLYMADNPERFHQTVIAEMRGQVDRRGKSPFWHALGKRFIGIKFVEADFLTATNKKRFIADLMPRTPIPVALLTNDAKKVIAMPHKNTAAAKYVLEKEGFEYAKYIDIFDAGPILQAKTMQLDAVRHSRVAKVSSISSKSLPTEGMVSAQTDDYRIAMGQFQYNEKKETVIISTQLAKLLNIETGTMIRIKER